MNSLSVKVEFKVYWRFKDFHYLKVTKCKKIVNTKTSKLLNYNTRGFYINNKYYKRNQLNKLIEPIPKKEYCPF